jgi:hypothetical protein
MKCKEFGYGGPLNDSFVGTVEIQVRSCGSTGGQPRGRRHRTYGSIQFFFRERGLRIMNLVQDVFVHKRNLSALKRVESVSDRMSYKINTKRSLVSCLIEDKTDDVKDSFYEDLECTFDKFPKCHKKIFLGDFSAKVGRKEIFKPKIGNENLHEISNDNGVTAVNSATSNNLTVKSKINPHHNIHKYT